MVIFRGKEGIIPTKYYKFESQKTVPPNTWRLRLNFKKIVNFTQGVPDPGPISITWSTKKKMGNTGKYLVPKDGTELPISKIYDIIETFTESSTQGSFKGKHLKILLKTVSFNAW